MRNRQLERRKKLAAWTGSSIAWVAAGLYWIDAFATNSLPWQLPRGYPVDLTELLVLMVAVGGVVAALPDDREDVNERRLWLTILWCLAPCLLLGLLFFYPPGLFR